ncbi:MAG: hypothetical protein Q8J93_04270, partial [Xanthomonadales bacterium]|nr:hypothetical protein [Xanthomonadales bacterium]
GAGLPANKRAKELRAQARSHERSGHCRNLGAALVGAGLPANKRAKELRAQARSHNKAETWPEKLRAQARSHKGRSPLLWNPCARLQPAKCAIINR